MPVTVEVDGSLPRVEGWSTQLWLVIGQVILTDFLSPHYSESMSSSQSPQLSQVACEVCGAEPAIRIKLRSASSRIIWWNYQSIDRKMCPACAERFYYAMQTRTLIQGWWGPLSAAATLLFSIMNIMAISSHRRSLPAIRTDAGEFVRVKIHVRKNPIAMVLSAIALIIIFSIATTYASAPTPVTSSEPSSYLSTCWQSGDTATQLKQVSCDSADAEYEVSLVVASPSGCQDLYIQAGTQIACLQRRL